MHRGMLVAPIDDAIAFKLEEMGRDKVAKECNVSAGTISRWIAAGAIPEYARSKIISILGISENEISESRRGILLRYKKKSMQKAQELEYTIDDDMNIFSLIKSIASVENENVTLGDINFLIQLKARFSNPLSPKLISEILHNRHQGK